MEAAVRREEAPAEGQDAGESAPPLTNRSLSFAFVVEPQLYLSRTKGDLAAAALARWVLQDDRPGVNAIREGPAGAGDETGAVHEVSASLRVVTSAYRFRRGLYWYVPIADRSGADAYPYVPMSHW